jgi:hypothetical protein
MMLEPPFPAAHSNAVRTAPRWDQTCYATHTQD